MDDKTLSNYIEIEKNISKAHTTSIKTMGNFITFFSYKRKINFPYKCFVCCRNTATKEDKNDGISRIKEDVSFNFKGTS